MTRVQAHARHRQRLLRVGEDDARARARTCDRLSGDLSRRDQGGHGAAHGGPFEEPGATNSHDGRSRSSSRYWGRFYGPRDHRRRGGVPHFNWEPNLAPFADIADIRVIRCRTDAATARARVESRGHRTAHADGPLLAGLDAGDLLLRGLRPHQDPTLRPWTRHDVGLRPAARSTPSWSARPVPAAGDADGEVVEPDQDGPLAGIAAGRSVERVTCLRDAERLRHRREHAVAARDIDPQSP